MTTLHTVDDDPRISAPPPDARDRLAPRDEGDAA